MKNVVQINFRRHKKIVETMIIHQMFIKELRHHITDVKKNDTGGFTITITINIQ